MWTEDRVQSLKLMWHDGLSASQIATRLGGVTRNAVMGKVDRLGLPKREPSGKAPAQTDHRVYATPSPPRRFATCVEQTEDRSETRAQSQACKWPIGEPGTPNFHFCGAKRARGAFCDDHAAIAYQNGSITVQGREPSTELTATFR